MLANDEGRWVDVPEPRLIDANALRSAVIKDLCRFPNMSVFMNRVLDLIARAPTCEPGEVEDEQ